MDKLENLKNLVGQIEGKVEFATEVANLYKIKPLSVMHVWLQNEWKVPKNKLDEIIKMAQNALFLQTERKRKILKDTGYKFKRG